MENFCPIQKNRLVLQPIGKDIFKVAQKFVYHHRFGGQNLPKPYIIPKGFRTNGFSIPALFRPIFSATDKGLEIAVVHDFLYNKKCKYKMPRRDADFIFYEGLRCLNVPTWKAKVMYIAVVLFGGKNWRRR